MARTTVLLVVLLVCVILGQVTGKRKNRNRNEDENQETCHPVTVRACRSYGGYDETSHHKQNKARQMLRKALKGSRRNRCTSDSFWPLVCSIVLPVCENGQPVNHLPCKSLCLKVFEDCPTSFSSVARHIGLDSECGHLEDTDCWSPSAVPTISPESFTFEDDMTTAEDTSLTPLNESNPILFALGEYCVPVRVEECLHVGYDATNHAFQDVISIMYDNAATYTSQCNSNAMWPFMCSFVLSPCRDNHPTNQKPCRSLCEQLQRECPMLLIQLAFELNTQPSCDVLPESDCWTPPPHSPGEANVDHELVEGDVTTVLSHESHPEKTVPRKKDWKKKKERRKKKTETHAQGADASGSRMPDAHINVIITMLVTSMTILKRLI